MGAMRRLGTWLGLGGERGDSFCATQFPEVRGVWERLLAGAARA